MWARDLISLSIARPLMRSLQLVVYGRPFCPQRGLSRSTWPNEKSTHREVPEILVLTPGDACEIERNGIIGPSESERKVGSWGGAVCMGPTTLSKARDALKTSEFRIRGTRKYRGPPKTHFAPQVYENGTEGKTELWTNTHDLFKVPPTSYWGSYKLPKPISSSVMPHPSCKKDWGAWFGRPSEDTDI